MPVGGVSRDFAAKTRRGFRGSAMSGKAEHTLRQLEAEYPTVSAWLDSPQWRGRRWPPPFCRTHRGRPLVYSWRTIERLDAVLCRSYHAETGRAPGWKKRARALAEKLDNAPHWKTLQLHYGGKNTERKSPSI
jgi:hypothetical protein